MDQFSISKASALFKETYYKKSDNLYNSANKVLMRKKIRNDFVGKKKHVANPLSFQGGVGSGTLPYAGVATYGDATIEAKKVYGRCKVERETIAAAINDKGAFVRATAETVKKTVESYLRNDSRILFGDGTGGLGQDDATTAITGVGSTANPFVVVMSSTNWKEANWEEQDFVHFDTDSGKTTLLQIYEVTPETKTVKFIHATGAGSSTLAAGAATGKKFYMQGSRNNDPKGLYGISMLTDAEIVASSTLYGIAIQRRWKMHTEDADGKAISTSIMNKLCLKIEKATGKVPNLIAMSYEQYGAYLDTLEDQKRFVVEPRYLKGTLKAKASYNAIAFASTMGDIPVVPERFVEDDRVYFLNMDYIECHRRPKFGWFDDDGTVFLRLQDDDAYEARYGGYYENFIIPTFHGVIYNLAVAA